MSDFQEFPKIARLNRDIVITEKIDGTNAQVLIEPVDGFPAGCSESEDLAWQAITYEQRKDAVTEISGHAIKAGSRSRWLQPGKGDNFGFAGWVKDNAETLVSLLGAGRHFGEWWGAGVQRRYGQATKRFSLFNVHRYGEVTGYLDPRCVTKEGVIEIRPLSEETRAKMNPEDLAIFDLHPQRTPWMQVEHKFHKGAKVCQCRDARPGLKAVVGGVPVDSVPVLYRGPWFALGLSNLRTVRTAWAPEAVLDNLRARGSVAAPGFDKPEGIVVFHEASSVLFKATLENDAAPKSQVV